jgi:hypothetical protein
MGEKGENSHRNNLLDLAGRCLREGDWENAALVAAQLLVAVQSSRGREKRNDDMMNREKKRLKSTQSQSQSQSHSRLMSSHSEKHLCDVWRVVAEIALHFPGQIPASSLERFSRKVYGMIPSRRQHQKHKKEITAEIVNLELATDLGRALTEINGLREADANHERLESVLTMGLIQYQLWCYQLRKDEDRDRDRDGSDGHGRVNFTEDLGRSLTSSDYNWYKPLRWSTVTEEHYTDAMEKLVPVFHLRTAQSLSFKMECLVMSRLFHLHAAKKNLKGFFQQMKEYREKQILRFRDSSTAYLARLDLLLCLLVEKLPRKYDESEVVGSILHYTSALANSEPSSTVPLETLLSMIKHIEEEGRTKETSEFNLLAELDLDLGLRDSSRSSNTDDVRFDVFKHLLTASFLHLDVCAASEKGWHCLARALEEMHSKQRKITREEQSQKEKERKDFILELWKPRRDWWRKLHFNGRVFLREMLSTEGQHPLLGPKLICCNYLDPGNKSLLSHAHRLPLPLQLPGGSPVPEEEEEGEEEDPMAVAEASDTDTDQKRDQHNDPNDEDEDDAGDQAIITDNNGHVGVKSFSLLSEALEALEDLQQGQGKGSRTTTTAAAAAGAGAGGGASEKDRRNKEIKKKRRTDQTAGLKISRKKVRFLVEFQ